jgi:hypothetical protein
MSTPPLVPIRKSPPGAFEIYARSRASSDAVPSNRSNASTPMPTENPSNSDLDAQDAKIKEVEAAIRGTEASISGKNKTTDLEDIKILRAEQDRLKAELVELKKVHESMKKLKAGTRRRRRKNKNKKKTRSRRH